MERLAVGRVPGQEGGGRLSVRGYAHERVPSSLGELLFQLEVGYEWEGGRVGSEGVLGGEPAQQGAGRMVAVLAEAALAVEDVYAVSLGKLVRLDPTVVGHDPVVGGETDLITLVCVQEEDGFYPVAMTGPACWKRCS